MIYTSPGALLLFAAFGGAQERSAPSQNSAKFPLQSDRVSLQSGLVLPCTVVFEFVLGGLLLFAASGAGIAANGLLQPSVFWGEGGSVKLLVPSFSRALLFYRFSVAAPAWRALLYLCFSAGPAYLV